MPMNQTLLIVDDSADVRGLVAAWLADEPVDLYEAVDGADGIEKARQLRPDLILLDVEMPGLDGFAACAILKADPALSDVPIVFLSGASTTEEKLRGLDLGAADYVTKPFDPAELRARVRASLRTKQLLDLLEQKAQVLQESEERFRVVAENSSDMISRHDAAGRFLYVSPACRAVIGHAAEDLVGRSVYDLVHADDLAVVAACYHLPSLAPAVAAGGPGSASIRLLHRAGHYVWCESTFRLLIDAATGNVREVHGSTRDVTARKRAEQLEQGRADVLEMVAQDQAVPAVMARLVDAAERLYPAAVAAVVATSDGKTHVAGPRLPAAIADGLVRHLTESVTVGDGGGGDRGGEDPAGGADSPVFVFDPRVDTTWGDAARAAAAAAGFAGCWAAPIRSGHDDATLGLFCLFHPEAAAAAGPDEVGRSFLRMAGRLIAVAVDHHQLNAQLAYRAQHDALTGLPNRTLYEERLADALDRAARDGHRLTVAFLDVDRFKDVNDTLGHHAGDQLLGRLAERVRHRLGPGDTLARMGGDEFALILPGLTTPDAVDRFGRSLTEAFAAQPLELLGHELFVTVSLGFAVYPDDGTDAGTLGKNADVALYAAKNAGRGRARCYEAAMTVGVGERVGLEASLRRALDLDQLYLVYQPKVDGQDRLIGLEALARWRSPVLGDVPPGRFIPLAEELGLIEPLGRWALHAAARQWRAWADAGLATVPVAVNVSAAQFAQADFVTTVTDALAAHGMPAAQLELELTETMLMRDVRQTKDRLEQLKAVGVSIAIDDFGTGYSSLAYLQRLPLDVLKIDRAFVIDIDAPAGDAAGNGTAVIRSIAALADSIGLSLVAEGVETERQREFLLGIGCGVHQGFLYSRPADVDGVEQMLRTGKVPRRRMVIGPVAPLARSA